MATSYTTPNQLGTLLRCREVTNLVGLSRSTIYVLVKDGSFPSPIQVGRRAVRWLASEVDAWIDSRILITRPLVMSASCTALDAVNTQPLPNQLNHISHPASKCPSQVVKANQGLTALTEVRSWTALAPASSPRLQARDAGRSSRQEAR